MKVVVFTYDRFKTATTSKMLEAENIPHDVVCHTKEQAKQFIEQGTVSAARIIPSGAPIGLANNRNWYIQNRLVMGEWCLMLVDDLIYTAEVEGYDEHARAGILPISPNNTTLWNRKFRNKITMRQFLKRAEELRDEAERVHSSLAGFTAYNNPLFRVEHYARNTLADGRAWVFKRTNLLLDPQVQSIEDYAYCAANLALLRTILVNKWVVAECSRYTKGGFGNMEARMERRRQECAYLVDKYKGILSYGNKKGWPAGTHLKFKTLSTERLASLYLNKRAILVR